MANILLEAFSIPSYITSIPENAFERCLNLKKMTIPESVTIIKTFAFVRCNSLVEVNIPHISKNN